MIKSPVEYISKWKGQLNKGILEFIVLTLLQEQKHGYEVLQHIRLNVPTTKNIADGPLYAILSRLRNDGLLNSKEVKVSGRLRRYFIISELGCTIRDMMEQEWVDLTSYLNKY